MRRRAEDVRMPPEMPESVRRRTRRRRLSNGLVAGLTAAVVVAGGVVGVQAALHGRAGRTRLGNSPAPSPATASGTFPAIWPERNTNALQAEQANVDQGNDSYRLDPSQTAVWLAHLVLGWDPTITAVDTKVPPGP